MKVIWEPNLRLLWAVPGGAGVEKKQQRVSREYFSVKVLPVGAIGLTWGEPLPRIKQNGKGK
jgi:hypothetical protein